MQAADVHIVSPQLKAPSLVDSENIPLCLILLMQQRYSAEAEQDWEQTSYCLTELNQSSTGCCSSSRLHHCPSGRGDDPSSMPLCSRRLGAPNRLVHLQPYTRSGSSVMKDTGKGGKSRCEMKAVKPRRVFGNKLGHSCSIINRMRWLTPLSETGVLSEEPEDSRLTPGGLTTPVSSDVKDC